MEYTSCRSLSSGSAAASRVSVDDAGSYLPIVRTASCCCVEAEAAPVEAKGGADLPLPCPARGQVLGLQRLHSFAVRQLHRAPNSGIKPRTSYNQSRASSNSRVELSGEIGPAFH
jgi:hypothetical protein